LCAEENLVVKKVSCKFASSNKKIKQTKQ